MSQQTLQGRLLSPAGFGCVLLCFFLPFVTVSCGPANDQLSATFTGLTMVSGGRPEITGTGLNADDIATIHALAADQYDLEPLAVLAALVILAAMASALVKRARTRHLVGASFATVALALLVGSILRAQYRLEHTRGSRFIDVDSIPDPGVASTRYGFWLTAALLAVLALGHGYALLRARAAPAVPAGAEPPPEFEPEFEPEPEFDESLFFRDPGPSPGDSGPPEQTRGREQT